MQFGPMVASTAQDERLAGRVVLKVSLLGGATLAFVFARVVTLASTSRGVRLGAVACVIVCATLMFICITTLWRGREIWGTF